MLYAFDLLLTMYEEAWADPDAPPSSETGSRLADDHADLASLRAAAPGLILRHNLHGVDIDPRAAQIAALALWLRAQRAYQDLNLAPAQRPRITKTHIVTAEPMPGDEELLDEFLRDLRPRVLGDLVRVVFEKMKLAGEAGSLLKIEEELSGAIAEARRLWAQESQAEQLALFPQERQPKPEQLPLFDVSGITDETFWETAENRVLRALRDYATQVENGRGTRRRLFVEDVAQGFAFVDLCRQRFNVALMNPPFGEATGQSARYFKSIYPNSKSDLATMFVERVSGLLKDTGVQGAITTRNPFLLSVSQRWREKVIFDSGSLWIFADLGMGVMDAAAVEAASYVLGRQKIQWQSVFIRLLLEENKMSALNQSILKLQQGQQSSRVFFVDPAEFLKVPGATLCYWASASMRKAFHTLEKLGDVASVEMGMSTKNNFRFLRCLWDVSPSSIGFENVWAPYAKGGESSPFSFVHDTLVLADNDFVQLKAELTRKYPYLQGNTGWVLHPEYSYGQPGLTYGRLVRRFSTNPLPAGFYFSESSSAIFPANQNDLLALMSLLSSDAVRGFLGMVTAVRKMEAGYIASIPIPSLDEPTHKVLSDLALQACRVQLARNSVNELSAYFVAPSFSEFGQSQLQNTTSLTDILDRIEQAAFSAYQMSDDDRRLVQREMKAITGLTTTFRSKDAQDQKNTSQFDSLALSYIIGSIVGRWDVRFAIDSTLVPKFAGPFKPLLACPPGMLITPNGLPATPGNIVSEAWLRARPDAISLPPPGSFDGSATIPDEAYPIRIAWDGILVDDPGLEGQEPHPNDVVRRVREALAVLWPENHDAIEAEACEILGVRELRDYFRDPNKFFADHLKRYSKSRRKAPIYWPLSTASGGYTVWLYYHRLDDETLYTAVNRYVAPKIGSVEGHVARLEAALDRASGRAATELRDQLDEARAFLVELREFRTELLRVAALPYKPNLNDGVIINAAPLHRLFRLSKWSGEVEKVWGKLEAGDYDWAHMAFTLWPERVREVCKRDRSIAIAHGLEDVCEVAAKAPRKKKRDRRKKETGQKELEL